MMGISGLRGFYKSQVYSRRSEAGWGMCQQLWGDKGLQFKLRLNILSGCITSDAEECWGNRVFNPFLLAPLEYLLLFS